MLVQLHITYLKIQQQARYELLHLQPGNVLSQTDAFPGRKEEEAAVHSASLLRGGFDPALRSEGFDVRTPDAGVAVDGSFVERHQGAGRHEMPGYGGAW